MIESCPVEVLDNIFECTAYTDPENAQATFSSRMLYFHKIAKHHPIRVVCLASMERVNPFAVHLTSVVKSGEYGESVLPIQHLAVVGRSRPSLNPKFRVKQSVQGRTSLSLS